MCGGAGWGDKGSSSKMKEYIGFPNSASRISSLNVCLWEYLIFSYLCNSEQVEEWASLGHWRTGGILQSVPV